MDIELVDKQLNGQEIADQYFSGSEATHINASHPDRRYTEFSHIWTHKEAFIKATGKGLSYPLDTFCVASSGEKTVRVVGCEDDSVTMPWSLTTLHPGRDHAASLAVAGSRCSLRLWQWKPDLS
ncbi:MAG: 4'-phosphopantetheinyl transferase superfamily protein [Pyrinomonadaceae bacterium]